MLFLYVMNPDKACLDKELLKRAGIGNEAEARVGFEKSSCGKTTPAGGKGPVCQEKGEVKAGHVSPVPGSAL